MCYFHLGFSNASFIAEGKVGSELEGASVVES